MRDIIRVSELSTWLRCRRKAYLAYEEGWSGSSVEAGIGTVVHAYLAEYYGKTGADLPRDELTHLTPEDWGTADAMFDTYKDEVESEGLDIGQTTVAVEKRLRMNMCGIALTGQIDHIVHDDIRGGLVIRDHKTVAQFQKTADRDFQLMCYALLVQDDLVKDYTTDDMPKIVAIEHNQIKRNKRTARSKPPYIDRQTRPLTFDALYRFRKQLDVVVSEYLNAMNNAWSVEDHALYAVGRNDCSWSCDFSDVCGMIDDGEDYASVLDIEFIRREAPIDITA